MARRRFGADLTSVVWRILSLSGVDGVLQLAPGQTATAWTAQTGGSQVTDLLDKTGAPATLVTADANGILDYSGPNTDPETVALWLETVPGGGRQLHIASDLWATVLSAATAAAAAAASASTLGTRTTALEARTVLQPLWLTYGTGAVPLRTSATTDTTRPVVWYGTTAPAIATNGGTGNNSAVDGLDLWVKY
jgi:hypothetical protein